MGICIDPAFAFFTNLAYLCAAKTELKDKQEFCNPHRRAGIAG